MLMSKHSALAWLQNGGPIEPFVGRGTGVTACAILRAIAGAIENPETWVPIEDPGFLRPRGRRSTHQVEYASTYARHIIVGMALDPDTIEVKDGAIRSTHNIIVRV